MRHRHSGRVGLVGAALAAAVLVPMTGTTAAGHDPEVVVGGLHNPRGIVFDGHIMWVAESGKGGAGPCIPGPEGGDVCYGETGSIVSFDITGDPRGQTIDPAQRLVSGLPSLAAVDDPATPQDETGTSAAGPADVTVIEGGVRVVFTIGLGADPAARTTLVDAGATRAAEFATVRSAIGADGSDEKQVADLGTHEADGDADGQGADTNPFGVLTTNEGNSLFVADSGGNTILKVLLDGTITTEAVLPPTMEPAPGFLDLPPGTRIPAQSVPTQIGYYQGGYVVGQLTGFPFTPGSSVVLESGFGDDGIREIPGAFTNVIDVATGPDGKLYVLEVSHGGLLSGDTSGALYRVDPDGTFQSELIWDDFFMPGGITFNPTDGLAYITDCGTCADTGEVVVFDAVNAPAIVSIGNETITDLREDLQAIVDVLANDRAAAGDVSLSRILSTDHGSASLGSIVYQPPANFFGEDRVTYEVCDAADNCAIGFVDINVTASPTDRLAGPTRTGTAVLASRAVYPGGADNVVIARSDDFPDALAASVLADVLEAPILLTSTTSLGADTAAEINRLGATTAYLIGGTAALSDTVASAIVSQTTVTSTVRVSGADRFATAVAIKDEIAELAGPLGDTVYIVEGRDADPGRGWPDAVSVSALAAHLHRPILLVTTEALPAATAAALSDFTSAVIIGGEAAVSTAVETAIRAIVGSDVGRTAGTDRYDTSAKVAQAGIEAGLDADLLWMASGGNWPDALVAGPLAARMGSVMILVHPSSLDGSAATRTYLTTHTPFTDIDLIGGTAAISQLTEDQIQGIVN